MAEQAVINLFNKENKPFSVQNLVDFLAHAGHKKAAITKALDSLTESGKIVVKEFGKTKIFLPNQSNFSVLSKEEVDSKKAAFANVTNLLKQEQEACRKIETELSSLRSCMPIEDMQAEINNLQAKAQALETKVSALRKGAVLVSAADRKVAETALSKGMDAWRKRRGIFKNVWGAVSESMEGRKESELFEEMGVDTDEAVGADFKALEALLPGPGPGNAFKKRKI